MALLQGLLSTLPSEPAGLVEDAALRLNLVVRLDLDQRTLHELGGA